MPQTEPLVATLKQTLKAHRKNYRDVAQVLGLSEASVKRLFSERNFSIQRLDSICQMMDMEISDLVLMMKENSQSLTRLSADQEREIASDVSMLLVTVCVLNRWRFQEIVNSFHITENQCIRHLAHLDRLKIIDLMPGNRIRLKVSSNFAWIPDGPIQRFFQERIAEDFFNSRFGRGDENLLVINGMLSKQSNAQFQRRMRRLAHEFDELNAEDAGLPLDERFGTTVVMAMRPWGYGVFNKIRR
ncbi:MAG: helix-turn-helix domain-containing protein [Gammaproteobacteria bacterium]